MQCGILDRWNQNGNWRENSRAPNKVWSSVNGNTASLLASWTLVCLVMFGGYFDNKMKKYLLSHAEAYYTVSFVKWILF